MHYYSTDGRRSRVIGTLAAFIYVAGWVVVMLVVNFRLNTEVIEEGVMLDIIGDPGQAAAMQQATVKPVQTVPQPPSQEELATQDTEEAPAIAPEKPKEKTKPKPQPEKPQEKPRQADPNALFRPSKNTSQGGATASAETGQGKGGYSGDEKGSGGGGVDSEYSVGNRTLVGRLPLPSTDYGKNKQGKVVVEIMVNEDGAVTSATYRAKGSTTSDNQLVRVAIEAARKARFTHGSSDIPEMGTITYTFKLQ